MIFTFYFWQWDTVRYTIYHIQYKIWTTVSLIQNVYLNTITCHEKMLAMSFSSKTSCFWPRRIKFSFIDQVGIQIFQFQGQMGHIKSIYWLIGKYSANSLLSKNGQPGLGSEVFLFGYVRYDSYRIQHTRIHTVCLQSRAILKCMIRGENSVKKRPPCIYI